MLIIKKEAVLLKKEVILAKKATKKRKAVPTMQYFKIHVSLPRAHAQGVK